MRDFIINSKRTTVFILIYIFCNVTISLSSDIQLLTGKEIIHNAIKAHGGEEALRELAGKNNITKKESIYFGLGKVMAIDVYYVKKPAKARMDRYFVAHDALMIQIYNDGKIRIIENGRVSENAKLIEAFRESAKNILSGKTTVYSVLLDLSDNKEKAKYAGEEEVNGKKCFALEFVMGAEEKRIYSFDTEKFLLRKVVNFSKNAKRTHYYDDFQKIDNAVLPFKKETYLEDEKIAETETTEISFDDLDDSLFEIPKGK